MNPMELYHNQVTRTQGPFSLRMFHRSLGPDADPGEHRGPLHAVGLSHARPLHRGDSRQRSTTSSASASIIPNVFKVKKMCELIRQHQPKATIVVGGHIANVPDLARWVDADHIVQGEGVRWFRRFLGEDAEQPDPPSADHLGPRHAHLGRAAPRAARRRGRHGHSRRSAARWAATSAPPRPCSAARETRSTSTEPATNCSTSCASSKTDLSVAVVLHHGRELPVPPQAGACGCWN